VAHSAFADALESPSHPIVRRSSMITPDNVSAFSGKAHLRGTATICWAEPTSTLDAHRRATLTTNEIES
jgi:hypothetical protein